MTDPTAGADEAKPRGWFGRLKAGLARSSSRIGEGLTAIFTKKPLDDDALEELEELLISADLGPATAAKLAGGLGRRRFGAETSAEEARAALAADIAEVLVPVAQPLVPNPERRPFVILVVGVNGTGKTTTIGKLAGRFVRDGRSVMLAAGDTFRAAAVAQLKIWGERVGCPVVARDTGADAPGLAFDALERARRDEVEILMIDTAGRLHNKADLMAELQKMVRVLQKLDPTAPHATILTLDATTGQNALAQVEMFQSMVGVTGLIVTKLDGSARGGVVVALAERFGLPVQADGVGEGAEDLGSFDAAAFADALVGAGAGRPPAAD